MALENLTIAQHRDTLRYATIWGGGYCHRLRRYEPREYVYLQQTAPTTLDVTAGRIILRVQVVLQSGVLLLEGRDGQVWKDHVRNCAPCHLPHIDGIVDPTLAIIPAGLRCMLCGHATGAATMLVCDKCSRGWHMGCLTPPLHAYLMENGCVHGVYDSDSSHISSIDVHIQYPDELWNSNIMDIWLKATNCKLAINDGAMTAPGLLVSLLS